MRVHPGTRIDKILTRRVTPHSVYVDVEDRLALVVPAGGADTMRLLRVAALRARVRGYALGLVMGPTLPLPLLRRD